jgi:anaerobic selenocysteine-containing dehydrogenase
MKMAVKKSICWFCYNSCHVLVHTDEHGRVTKVTGDPEGWQRGFICERGLAGSEVHDHPLRINYPMKRVGERGEGKWQRISWDQALDEVAARLEEIKEKYGAEAVANTRGGWKPSYPYMGRFMHLFGSPNYVGPGHICYTSGLSVATATYGTHVVPQLYGGAKLALMWGRNLPQSHPLYWPLVQHFKQEQGLKLIVIDPVRSQAAKAADLWLQPRPATDGALALAFLNVIIEENLFDQEFVEKYTHGFDKLAERVKEYPPEKVAQITGVPAEGIREAARLYAMTKPAIIMSGVKFDQFGLNSAQAYRAICCLRAISGNLNVQGGELIHGQVRTGIMKIVSDTELELGEKLPPEQYEKQPGYPKFKLMSWPTYKRIFEKIANEAPDWGSTMIDNPTDLAAAHAPSLFRQIISGDPYPIKALFILSNNTLFEHTNPKLVYEALKKVNLLVTYDIFMTPTAAFADYVFPGAEWIERPELMPTYQYGAVNAEERAVEPLYERRDDYQLWRGLAIRLGQEEYWPWKTLEEVYDYRVKALGLTFKELVEKVHPPSELFRGEEDKATYRLHEKDGFATPTRKVELYSTIFEQLGLDPLPYYEEPPWSPVRTPDLAEKYPLIVIQGSKLRLFTHSQFWVVTSVREQSVDWYDGRGPITLIHSDTAKKLGISDDDWVYIENQFGRIKQRAKLTADILPNVVHCQHAGWLPEKTEEAIEGVWESYTGALFNDDPDVCDRAHGGWPFIGLCKVYKA